MFPNPAIEGVPNYSAWIADALQIAALVLVLLLFFYIPKALAMNSKKTATATATKTATAQPTVTETALLAGGCFWGVEDLLRKQPGVVSTRVGYTGGALPNPRYEEIKKGDTGHAEALQIVFDPKLTTYEKILEYFFKIHDPTTLNQQGNDKGSQYRSAIFYNSPQQQATALAVKARVEKSKHWKNPVVTEITKAGPFFEAEAYHQDYLIKNPGGYSCHYERKVSY